LGHEDKKILERGIDGWLAAQGELVSEAKKLDPLLYQTPPNELRLRTWVDGDFIYGRLGDPHYQILDVRSPEEYLGEKPNVGLQGEVLKLGHIPTAVNVDYVLNWVDPDTKLLKPYPELQELYRGLNSSKGVVVYCHSGRRSSFSYFVLRLMGFSDVILYDRSWNEWGNSQFYFPVETEAHRLATTALPQAQERVRTERVAPGRDARQTAKGGYVSCGG
jgi:thiosulfate/3-mercaptopyruvate sulfurtransferase